jgi:threonine dehydrogenase-like Zn-dependent dehydrogenase
MAGGRFTSLRDKGVFGEYFHIPDVDMNVARIPEGVSIASAVLATDMITAGFHGVELADVKFGDSVVVIGIGPVGLMAVAGAALRGAAQIIAIGDYPITRQLAMEYGANVTLDYHDGPIPEQVFSITGGKTVDCVILAGGNESLVTEALRMVRVGGRVANLVGQAGKIEISGADFNIMCGHKVLTGGLCPGGRRRMERILSMIQCGRLNPDKLITHKFYGLDAIEEAFYLMAEKPKDLIKPIVYIEK